jgi:hypothetical protein
MPSLINCNHVTYSVMHHVLCCCIHLQPQIGISPLNIMSVTKYVQPHVDDIGNIYTGISFSKYDWAVILALRYDLLM